MSRACPGLVIVLAYVSITVMAFQFCLCCLGQSRVEINTSSQLNAGQVDAEAFLKKSFCLVYDQT